MKLLVVGATGRTGRLVLVQGVQREHEVTAFVRTPGKLGKVEGVAQVIQGDALNVSDVRQAVRGQDAVISAVGGSSIAHNFISVMTGAPTRRFVMTSSRSVVATRPWLAVTLAWLVFRRPYADLARAEGMLEVSGLDWSVVRATMLTDKPFTGRVHTDFEPNATGGEMTLTRADYAMALLDVTENPQMIGKAVGVCGAKPVRPSQRHFAKGRG